MNKESTYYENQQAGLTGNQYNENTVYYESTPNRVTQDHSNENFSTNGSATFDNNFYQQFNGNSIPNFETLENYTTPYSISFFEKILTVFKQPGFVLGIFLGQIVTHIIDLVFVERIIYFFHRLLEF